MNEPFFGRSDELRSLQDLYDKAGFQMCVLYGRRRIGKTMLLRKFTEKLYPVFFTAVQTLPERNLRLFTSCVLERFSPDMASFSLDSFESLFSYLSNMCKKERVVVVIDEFQYLAESDSGLLSLMQSYIDNEWKSGQMFLILSGSSISFMEKKVLSEKSPIFGRRTAQIKLSKFDYMDSALFVSHYTAEEKAIVYGLTGGVAKYLSLFDDSISLDENIVRNIFSKSGYLFEEPQNYLTQEFRNVPLYSSIIGMIASGVNKPGKIADKLHLDSSSVAQALKSLITAELVEKIHAMTDENNNKKVLYNLKDMMFRFWYRFVQDGLSVIEAGGGEIYYQKVVKPMIPDYMGHVFEEMCRTYTLKKGIEGEFGDLITKVGTWWGTNTEKKEQTDIDVVALASPGKKVLIGECKYKNEVLDKQVYEQLDVKRNLLGSKYKTSGLILFSKSGFSDWVKDKEGDGVFLVDLEKMYMI